MDVPESGCGAAQLLGYTAAGYTALRAFQFIKLNFCHAANLSKYKKSAGPWAVITGASEGIGRAFAEELAKNGFDLILISLPDAQLEKTTQELRQKYSDEKGEGGGNEEGKKVLRIQSIGFNFAKQSNDPSYSQHLFQQITAITQNEGISILVNNVGVNYTFPHYFNEEPIQKDEMIVNVNCHAQVAMTKFVLPHMKKCRGGAVINMSSLFGFLPGALLSTYSATKKFNAQFSQSMGVECKEFNIDFLVVAPAFVATRMSRRKAGWLVDTPEKLVSCSLKQLGATAVTSGSVTQNLIGVVFHVLPEAWVERLVFRSNSQVRTLGLKKEDVERKKAKL